MNKKAFVLTETLIVSAVVLTTLVVIYAQFSKINTSYSDSYLYNNINDLYTLKQVGDFIEDENSATLYNAITTYIDITNCSSTYFIAATYCTDIINTSNIKTLLITTSDTTSLISALYTTNPYTLQMQNFSKAIPNNNANYSYRLVAEFNNGTFASVPIVYKAS